MPDDEYETVDVEFGEASETKALLSVDVPLVVRTIARGSSVRELVETLLVRQRSGHRSDEAPGDDAAEVAELRRFFDDADEDGSGYIELDELRAAVARWGTGGATVMHSSVLDFVSSNPSELQIGRLFRLLDEDSSGTIDFDEFRHLAQLIHVSMDEGSPSKDPTQLTGVPTLSRLESTRRRLRVLALHGHGSNAAVSRLQLTNLGLLDGAAGKRFSFEFIDGPFVCERDLDETSGIDSDGPCFSWLDSDGDVEKTVMGLSKSLVAAVAKFGPFDGIYGFSRGGALALACLQPDFVALVPGLGKAKLSPSFVISACASSLSRVRVALGLPAQCESRINCDAGVAPVRTLHLVGLNDLQYKPEAEANALDHFLHRDPNLGLVYLRVGHELPRTLRVDAEWRGNAILAFVSASPSAAVREFLGRGVPISKLSKLHAYIGSQRCDCELDARGPQTLLEALACAPNQDAIYLRGARPSEGSAASPFATSYGALRASVAAVAELAAALRLESPSDALVYATPPDGAISAAAAIAFFTFASVCVAAPLDAATPTHDAEESINQYHASRVAAWRGGCEEGIREAAVRCKARVFEAHFAVPSSTSGSAALVVVTDAVDASQQSPLTSGRAAATSFQTSLWRVPAAEDVALFLRTSGTTSKPKVVQLRQFQIVVNGRALASTLELTAADVCLNCMPLYHIGGLSGSLLATLGAFGQVKCLASKFQADAFLDALKDQNAPPTWYSAVPTIHNAVVACANARQIALAQKLIDEEEQHEESNDVGQLRRNSSSPFSSDDKEEEEARWHSLRFVRSGAAALSPSDQRRLSLCFGGIPVLATYAMSEQMPISQPPAGFGLRQVEEKPGTVGVPVATSLCVVDEYLRPRARFTHTAGGFLADHHHERPALMIEPFFEKASVQPSIISQGEPVPGEVAICGAGVMRSYYENDDANAKSFFVLDGRRWFLTGDVGFVDLDGHLRLTGRSKELIKRGGEQVSPYEVEDALVDDVRIRVAVVFAVPSTVWGEEVGVCLVLATGVAEQARVEREQRAKREQDELDTAALYRPRGGDGWKNNNTSRPPDSRTVPRRGGGGGGVSHHLLDLSEAELKKMVVEACARCELAAYKVPRYVVSRREEELPKTRTRKYVRTGLCEVLGVVAADVKAAALLKEGDVIVTRRQRSPPKISEALAGSRFPLVVWTMLQHFGSKRSLSKWAQPRGYNLHMPLFFALAGFQLASSFGPPVKNLSALSKSHRRWVWARFSSVHPLYLLSIACCAALLLTQCRPSLYRDGEFEWEAQKDYNSEDRWRWTPAEADDGDVRPHAFCEPTPVDLGSFSLTYVVSVLTYALGLQAWPFAIGVSWFVSYYTWFQSVYYFCLVCFPFVYKRLHAMRGDSAKLWRFMFYCHAANYGCFVAPYLALYLKWATHYRHNTALSLALYLFPPTWTPFFFAGATACFLLDHYRSYRDANARLKWGRIGDLISLGFFATILALRFDQSGMQPHATEHNKLLQRIWTVIYSRLHMPFALAWLYALAVGEGRTAALLKTKLLSQQLGPISFGCYLFHQPVGALYMLLTRKTVWSWWRYRKLFFWFSPYPVPVPWYEAVFLIFLTTLVSIALDTHVNWRLITLWNNFFARFGRLETHDDVDTLQAVLNVVASLTGVEVDDPDVTLEQCGLASVGAPVLAGLLSQKLPSISVSTADLVSATSLRDIANNLDTRIQHAQAAHVM